MCQKCSSIIPATKSCRAALQEPGAAAAAAKKKDSVNYKLFL